MDVITIIVIFLFIIVIILILIIAINKGVLNKAKFWTNWGGAELEGGEKKKMQYDKNKNWILGPDGRKYDFSTGVLRHIPDPESLDSLGYDRRQFVEWDKKRFETESIGHEIESVKRAKLVRKGQTSGVYIILEGSKRWVPDIETLMAIGRTLDDVTSISDEEFNNIQSNGRLKKKSEWYKK